MVISKAVWRDVLNVLKEHKIPYTTHVESRDIPRVIEKEDTTVHDLHILINLVVPNYFEENVDI